MLINVLLIILFVFDFAIIYMIYFYNPSGTINRFLSLLIMPIMLSNIEMLLLRAFESSFSVDIGLNMAFIGAIAFFPIFYHFSYYYPRNVMNQQKKHRIIILYISIVILGAALLVSYLLKPEAVSQADIFNIIKFFKINPVFFLIYIIMFIYVSALLAITIFRFTKSLGMNLMPGEKRIIIMILAGVIPTSFSMIFSYFIFLPLRSGINIFLIVSAFYTIYFIILLLSFGFLDKKAALRTLFTYPVTIVIIFILFNFIINDFNTFICKALNFKLSILLVSEVMIVFLLLQPLVRILESRLIRGGHAIGGDFHKLMMDVSGSLVSVINLIELDNFLNDLFISQLHISSFHFLIVDDEHDCFNVIKHEHNDSFSFSASGELAGQLEGYRRIMNIQQMSLAWHGGEELAELYKQKIVLIAPLFEKEELIGCCLFGEPGPVRAWYPSEVDELEHFLSGVPVVIARCRTHEAAISLEKKQAAIEKLAVLGEISSGIAHEIRNPLSIISASAETISGRDLSREEVKRFASYIQDETNRMSSLLNRLLKISVNPTLQHRPVNVISIIQRSLDLVSNKLRKKRLISDFQYERQNCIAVIDNEVLMQVCLNLLLNAIDAMSEGMKLGIEANYYDSSMVRILFSNQGARIPEDLRSRIFDPFFTTKKNGTGLGLSITQRLIKEASGEIILLDSEDETVFQILIPAASEII